MIQVAVGIIIRKEISIRTVPTLSGLKWEFPGGKVEKDETTEECLLRELTEELSITAVIGSLYHQQQYLYPDSGTFDVFYYMIRQFSGSIVNRVFESFEWVSTAKLLEYDILEGNRDVVKKLMHEFR